MSVSWGLLFLALLLCMPSVTALGLSYEYLEDKTLELGPGENYFFKLIFQNDEDEDVRIQVTLNSDIAELVGDAEITIPEQTYDSFVYFDIKVPKEAASGDTFSINYEVLPLKDGEGQVPFSVKYSRSFRVLVVDKVVPDVQTPSDMNLVARNKVSFGGIGITLLLLVVITALIVLIWRRSELLTGHFTPRQRAPKTLPVQKPPKPSRNHHLKEATKAKFHKAEKTAEVLASKAASELSKAAHGAAEYAHHVKEEHDKKVKKHEKDQHSKTHKSRKHKAEHDHEPKPHFTLDQLSQNQAPPDKQFILSDGTSIRNLHGFYRAVQAMDTATLHIYINKEKNDFQLWIADSLKLPHVAARVGLATSKKEVLRALEET